MTDPTPYDRRSPMEHERDAGPRESTADMIARLRNPGAWVSPDDLARLIALVDELLMRSARQFARAHEAAQRPMTEAEVDELLGIKREGGA